jgi:hypothetical protein
MSGEGWNNSNIALGVLRSYVVGTLCLRIYLDNLVPGGYKYGDLTLQVTEVVVRPTGLGLENGIAGEDQQQL